MKRKKVAPKKRHAAAKALAQPQYRQKVKPKKRRRAPDDMGVVLAAALEKTK